MYIVHICFDKAVNKAATGPIRCFYTGVPFSSIWTWNSIGLNALRPCNYCKHVATLVFPFYHFALFISSWHGCIRFSADLASLFQTPVCCLSNIVSGQFKKFVRQF